MNKKLVEITLKVNPSIDMRMLAVDLTNKENIISVLSNLYTDEDFTGNNGEGFTKEIAIQNGFESTQDYVIDKLEKSDKNGFELIESFLDEWLGSDNYYSSYDYTTTTINGITVIAIAFTTQA